jgi:hypothetical protein
MSTLNLNKRDALRDRIENTLAAAHAHADELTADVIAAEVQAAAEELALEAFQLGLRAGLGPELGPVAYADLLNEIGESDAELSRRFGMSRSAVSKVLRRVRRNLDIPIRQPTKQRRPHRRTLPALKEAA